MCLDWMRSSSTLNTDSEGVVLSCGCWAVRHSLLPAGAKEIVIHAKVEIPRFKMILIDFQFKFFGDFHVQGRWNLERVRWKSLRVRCKFLLGIELFSWIIFDYQSHFWKFFEKNGNLFSKFSLKMSKIWSKQWRSVCQTRSPMRSICESAKLGP